MESYNINWFNKFIAVVWLVSVLMLTTIINQAFISNIRDLQGKLGLLRRPTTSAIEWKVDKFVKSLFQPIDAQAQSAVVCVGGCLSGEAYLASRASERAEITLLRSLLTAFVRTVLTFIQNFILTIIKQLTNAQDQFNFLRSVSQYAEQAVLLASKQAYSCANDSITSWSYSLFSETPPESSFNNCKTGAVANSNPTDTDVIASSQDYIDQCSVLSVSSIKPTGCTDSEIRNIQVQTDEVIKEKIQNECESLYTSPLYENITGGLYSCAGKVTEEVSKIRQSSQERTAKIQASATASFNDFKNATGTDAPFIAANADVFTPSSDSTQDSSGSANPVFYPLSLDVFDSSNISAGNLKIGFAKDPEALKFSHEYAAAAINSKPQPSGESDNLATVIQDAFKGLLDQLLQKLQDMLFSFLNNLIAKLDLATGGSGVFASVLSDLTGSVKTYARTKVSGLYNDINSQRQALINNKTKTIAAGTSTTNTSTSLALIP